MFVTNRVTLGAASLTAFLALGAFSASSAGAVTVTIPASSVSSNIPVGGATPTLTGTTPTYTLSTGNLEVVGKTGVFTGLSAATSVGVRDLILLQDSGQTYNVSALDVLPTTPPQPALSGVQSYLNFGTQTLTGLGTGTLTFDLFGSSPGFNQFTVQTVADDFSVRSSVLNGLNGRFVFSTGNRTLAAQGILDSFEILGSGSYQIGLRTEQTTFSEIPEPFTILGSTVGLGFLGAFKRMKNKKQASKAA